MFSGIVEEIGFILSSLRREGLLTLTIGADKTLDGICIGDSISVNGVCLTVCSSTESSFTVEIILETLSKSNLGALEPEAIVNLERSITPTTRIGGHFVQGHIDTTVNILDIDNEGEALKIWFSIPEKWKDCLIPKGFVAIDGMSLTIVDVLEHEFSICFIPHTQVNTVVKKYHVGTAVNIEIDHLTKTIVHIVNQRMAQTVIPIPSFESSEINEGPVLLQRIMHGFR